MSDTWSDRVQRGLSLLDSSNDEHTVTICMLNKVLDANVSDLYISHDFYNVQQTAGGLPDGYSFDQFLAAVGGHIRDEIMSSSFAPEVADADMLASVLTWDSNIRYHFRFLNGIVHQIAAGEVHVKLWNLILDSIKNDNSIYACYRSIIIDDR